MTDVEKKISAIVRGLTDQKPGSQGAVTDDAAMNMRLSDLGLDSLEKMDMAMQLEDAFAVSLDEVEFLACDTVPDLVRLIEGSTSAQ